MNNDNDTPITIAGTSPTWAPREPDLSFPRHSNGRLHLPNTAYRKQEFPLVRKATNGWRMRHQKNDLADVIPLGFVELEPKSEGQ